MGFDADEAAYRAAKGGMMDTSKIEKLLAAATPRPWEVTENHVHAPLGNVAKAWRIWDKDGRESTERNAALIALAPTLAAEVLRLTARIAQLEAVVAAGDGLAEAAKLHGYLDGYAAATADVEVMRATDGVLAGQSLIVSALKIGLTKMRSSLAIPTPPASPEVAALVDAGKPLLDMALWTESAADGEIVIMTVGTIRKLRTALSALEAKP